jgi:hypothetical protein
MADPTPTPTPSTTPNNHRAPRGPINQALLDELDKSEKVARTAQSTAFASTLSERDIDAALLTTLLSDITAVREKAAGAVSHSATKEGTTGNEAKLMEDLISSIREVQSAAKQKYDSGDRTHLANYYIGHKLDDRGSLVQIATAMLDRLDGAAPKDTLPGIKAPKITQLKTRLTAYGQVDLDQAGAQGDASGARTEFEKQVESIKQRRRQIQFAADAEWPSSDPANAATRRQFSLPPDRPLT